MKREQVDKTVCSIEMYQSHRGYGYVLSGKDGKQIARRNSWYKVVGETITLAVSGAWYKVADDPTNWDGVVQDLSGIKVSQDIQIATIKSVGNERSAKARNIWRERLISEKHLSLWLEERDSYAEYKHSDDDCKHYGLTTFFSPSPSEIQEILDSCQQKNSIDRFSRLLRKAINVP